MGLPGKLLECQQVPVLRRKNKVFFYKTGRSPSPIPHASPGIRRDLAQQPRSIITLRLMGTVDLGNRSAIEGRAVAPCPVVLMNLQ